MSGDQIVGIGLLERRNDLSNVIVGQWWHDVETADERVHLLDAGRRLRLPDGIDDPAVTAGRQHDQSLVCDDEVLGYRMLEVIGNEGAGIFRRRNLRRETSETVDDPDLLAAW